MDADRTPAPPAGAILPDLDPATAHAATTDALTVTEHGDGRIVVQVVGDLDALSAPGVRTTLLELVDRRPTSLVVDLAGVDFLDSAGISALVVAHNRSIDADVTLALAAVPVGCRRVLEITSLADVFTIVE